MQLIITRDADTAAIKVADIIEEAVVNQPNLVMGLATGRASAGAYRELVRRYRSNLKITFRQASSFNTDEFLGLGSNDPHSNRYFMNTNFFQHVDIPAENTHVPKGDTKNLEAECQAYDYMIDSHGGLDLVVLGLGYNGHVGFNEPGSSIKSQTRVVQFTDSTLASLSDGDRFRSLKETPSSAISIGLSTIFAARHVLLIATGIGKADAVHQMLEGKAGPAFPASMLKRHVNLTMIVDRYSAEKLKSYPDHTQNMA
jgi:glucosamine-6-phosphate deaminase